MRITRINQRPNSNKNLTKPKQPRRKIRRYVKESDIPAAVAVTEPLNIPGVFTYADPRRTEQASEMIKHQINQAVFNYGMDLQYFRKFNTFFKDGVEEENHANLIYGEDTTAEYYASGMIRAFVSVDNMAWSFNQIGLEGTEQISIYVTIDNFEQAFQDKIAKIETRYIEVPVFGDTRTCEVTGMIVEPEFQAEVYAQFDEDDMKVDNAHARIVPKSVDTNFYRPLKYQPSENIVSGVLKGRLKPHKELPFEVSGILKGELSFHGTKNLEDAETWKRLAPQVGDYFHLKVQNGVEEEWEITQLFDKNLTKGGLNPLLRKYVYQMNAVRRVKSHEKNTVDLDAKEIGSDIEELLGDVSGRRASDKEILPDQFKEKKKKNVLNKKTSRLGKNVYDYNLKEDEIYGGIQNTPKAK